MVRLEEPSFQWDELPSDLQYEVLSFLPLERLCKFRSVCQEWNDLITSTEFLLLCNANSKNPFAAYCFSTRTWTTSASLSFLWDQEKPEFLYCNGSAAGLYLVSMNPKETIIVCNPLRATSFKLPAMSSIKKVVVKGIERGGDGISYRVVAVGISSANRRQMVEIYDSSRKSWKIAAQLPNYFLVLREPGKGNAIVFDEGFFYCCVLNELGRPRPWEIMCFNVVERTWILVSAPFDQWLDHGEFTMWPPFRLLPQLRICGSRVLLARAMVQVSSHILQDVIVWEFQKDKLKARDGNIPANSPWWIEITRMPPHILTDFQRIWSVEKRFDCAGVGDYLCFRPDFRAGKEVVVYDLSKNLWSWLPSCPIPGPFKSTMAFKPRLDMKVPYSRASLRKLAKRISCSHE